MFEKKKKNEKNRKEIIYYECRKGEKSEQEKKRQAEALKKGQDTRRARNVCKLCGTKGHFGTECEKQWCERCQQHGHKWDKCSTYSREKKNEMMNREKAKILLEPILEKIQRK